MTPEARKEHGVRPVPHLSCDEDWVRAAPLLLLLSEGNSCHHHAAHCSRLLHSPPPFSYTCCRHEMFQAPTAMPGACQVHMLLSLSHTFPKGKKIHSLEIPFSVHCSSSRKNKPGQDGHKTTSLFRKASLDTQRYQVYYFGVK